MAFIQCWTCVGNGITQYPNCAPEVCTDCGGTGCDRKKTRETKQILESEKTYPRPLKVSQ